MSNFVYEFFKPETIEHPLLDNLYDILRILQENYLNSIAEEYEINSDTHTRNEIIDILTEKIPSDFKNRLMAFTPEEHRAFYDFYNGIVDYSDEMVYVNLKKFSKMGIIFLFTENGGKLYNFRIPEELCKKYEYLLQNS